MSVRLVRALSLFAIFFTAPLAVAADTGWVRVDNALPGTTIVSLAASDTRFVALNTNRDLMWSDDGRTWHPSAPLPPVAFLGGLVYGNGRFVASGTGLVLTSADGVEWQRHRTPNLVLQHLHFTGSRFVAYVNRKGVFQSMDGVDWQPVNGIPTDAIAGYAVTHGGITLLPADGQRLFRSTDGVSWTSISVPFGPINVFWNGTSWSAVGNSLYASADGVSWAQQFGVNIPFDSITSIETPGGTYVLQKDGAYLSFDVGTQGDAFAVQGGGHLRCIAVSGDRILVAGETGNIYLHGAGSGWEKISGNGLLNSTLSALTHAELDGRLYVWWREHHSTNIGGPNGPYGAGWVQSTTDGETWDAQRVGWPLLTTVVPFASALYGASYGTILRSTDGATWVEVAQLPGRAQALATDGTALIATVYDDAHFIYGFARSTDGSTWTTSWVTGGVAPVQLLFEGAWTAYPRDGLGRWTSADGVEWTYSDTSPIQAGYGLWAQGGRRSARAGAWAYQVSMDGETWTTIPNGVWLSSLPVWAEGRWISVGVGDTDIYAQVMESDDGLDWRMVGSTERTAPTYVAATSFGVFAFGAGGSIQRRTATVSLAPRVPAETRLAASIVGSNPGDLATITGLPAGTRYLLIDDRFGEARVELDESTGAFDVQHSLYALDEGAFDYVAEVDGRTSNVGRIAYGAAVPAPASYADLGVTAAPPTKRVKVKQAAKFSFTVRHTGGQAPGNNVSVRIEFQGGATLASVTLKNASCTKFGSYAICQLKAPLLPGAALTGSVSLKATVIGALTVSVVVGSSTPDINPSNNKAWATKVIG